MTIHPIQSNARYLTEKHKCQPQGGARGKVSGIRKVIRIYPLMTMNVQNVMAVLLEMVQGHQSVNVDRTGILSDSL